MAVIPAHMKGYVTRKRMVHEVRKEYLDVCASLEPGFDPSRVHWPRKDVLCSPLWDVNQEAASPLNHSQTGLRPHLDEEHVQHVHATEDGATPRAQSTEETVPVHTVQTKYGPTASLPSTIEHEERQDESEATLLAVKGRERRETDTVAYLPVASDRVEQVMCSPPGGLQTSTLGSVSDLSVSSSQLSLSIEDDDCVRNDSRSNIQENGTDDDTFKQEKEEECSEESNEALTQLTSTREQSQPRGKGSPPTTVLIEERPVVEVQEEVVCESQRKEVHARDDDAGPDTPEELFFREISAIIASAEQEGKSYEELKTQLELELVWVKQAIHSRQQYLLLKNEIHGHS